MIWNLLMSGILVFLMIVFLMGWKFVIVVGLVLFLLICMVLGMMRFFNVFLY